MIPDQEGVEFLQWCLPRLHLRWRGFRKVRRQVLKRIQRRLAELALRNVEAYRDFLENHPEEWKTLDAFCWIGISRFYRDQSVFQHLENEILPELARLALRRGEGELRCWSAGCAGGEEAYTLAILYQHRLAQQFPTLRLRIVATDVDPEAIRRARGGCFSHSSLKALPDELRARAFNLVAGQMCVKEEYRGNVTFVVQDIREGAPDERFHIIFCRNLAFTYFDEALQRNTMETLENRLAPAGVLIVGKLESLPKGTWGIEPWIPELGMFRKLSKGEEEGNKERIAF